MSDPITFTVLTLAAAKAFLSGAANEAGHAAARDAYSALRKSLASKYPDVVPKMEELERDPNSRKLQNQLAAALRSSNASNDKTIEQLAEQLKDSIEYGVDPVDQLKRTVGYGQLNDALNDHLEHIIRARAQYHVNGSDLLSSNVHHATGVPDQIRDEVKALHGRIRQIIEHYALIIEAGKSAETEDLIESLPARNMQERALRLVNADKDLNVSYETLRLTVDFFGRFNSGILLAIREEPSKDRQMQMMFGNAILLYELADYVIDFVSDFVPGGMADLEDLHQEAMRRVETIRTAQRKLTEKAKSDDVDQQVRDEILRNADDREKALTSFVQEWEDYIAEAKQLYRPVDDIRRNIPSLDLIRENASLQIDFLEEVAMLRFLKQNTRSIQATIDILKGLHLARLDVSRVRKLLEP